MCASLQPASKGGEGTVSESAQGLVGTLVSSLHRLKDINNQGAPRHAPTKAYDLQTY